MRIRCNARFAPFSHEAGSFVVLPGTPFRFQIFPALIRVSQFEKDLKEEVKVNGQGPFTVQLDLERYWILVFGKGFKYRIERSLNSWGITVIQGQETLQIDQKYLIKQVVFQKNISERLHLGCYKKQDWNLIKRRSDLVEIFPYWYRLGQSFSETYPAKGGCADLLKQDSLADLWKVGFEGIISPRLSDTDHQGYSLSEDIEGNPLALLVEGAHLIRSLFVKGEGRRLVILPAVPKKFHCGKFINVCWNGHEIDIEWTKNKLRRMIIRAGRSEKIELVLPNEIKRFRLDGVVRSHEQIPLESGSTYFLDRFER